MLRTRVESSNIATVGYDEDQQIMEIVFRDGRVYHYLEVPPERALSLLRAESKGRFLNRVIKQIVYAGAPYNAFTEEMRKDGDILQIVRTWTFTNNSLKTKSVSK